MKEYTNTIKACAYSLGVHADTLAHMIPLIKAVDDARSKSVKGGEPSPTIETLIVELNMNGELCRLSPSTRI
jgi:hypothetical protein